MIFARLIDHFHLTPSDLASLTDRQIVELYFAPRDEHGGIIEDRKAPKTYEGEMATIDRLAAMLRLKPDNVAELKTKVKERYGRQSVSAAN